MANQTITENSIKIDGRGSLYERFRYNVKSGNTTTQVDLTGRTVFFEIDGSSYRVEMAPWPGDPTCKTLSLTNSQIMKLAKAPNTQNFTVLDETNAGDGYPRTLWRGTISRDGYIGLPDNKAD